MAKVPAMRNGGCFPKTDFTIDLDAERCICPAGRQGIACYTAADGELWSEGEIATAITFTAVASVSSVGFGRASYISRIRSAK